MQKKLKNLILIATIIFTPISAFAIKDVLTGTANFVSDTQAKLWGSFNPEGKNSTGYFRYSQMEKPPVYCNDIYGSAVRYSTDAWIPTTNTAQTFNLTVYGLEENTKYYYCAIASSKTEIRYGGVKEFTTAPCSTCDSASVKTLTALPANPTSAYLKGSYNSTTSSETWFEYRKINGAIDSIGNFLGLTLNSWKKTPSNTHGIGAGNISTFVTGLSSGSQYEFRAVLKIGTTNYYGDVFNFTTLGDSVPTTGNTTGGTEYTPFCVGCNGTGGGTPYEGGGIDGDGTGGNTTTGEGNGGTYTGGGNGGNGGGNTTGGNGSNGNGGNNGNGNTNNTTNLTPHIVGDIATPPTDATVHYHEGIETVFTRQIMGIPELAKKFGYTEDQNLQNFAWNFADFLARSFGYVSPSGKEIRVSFPDIAAYQLGFLNGKLTVYEYYDKKIVHIQNLTDELRENYEYEYYFNKKR